MADEPTILLLHGVGASARTWWRASEDLTELGWSVTAVDLLGHGGRTVGPAGLRSLDDFAADVAAQVGDQHFDVVLGHSLGALVALLVGATYPTLADRVLIEDPPALGGSLTVEQVTDGLVADHHRAVDVPDQAAREVAAANPRWATNDVERVVWNRQHVDLAPVADWLRTASWDLTFLVTDCPQPVGLIAAVGPDSTLVEPARSQLRATLGEDRVVAIEGGHSLHRDRPALWLRAVLGLAARV